MASPSSRSIAGSDDANEQKTPKFGQFITGEGLVSAYTTMFEQTSTIKSTTKKQRKLMRASSADFNFVCPTFDSNKFNDNQSIIDGKNFFCDHEELTNDVFVLDNKLQLGTLDNNSYNKPHLNDDEKPKQTEECTNKVTVKLSATSKCDRFEPPSFYEKTIYINNDF